MTFTLDAALALLKRFWWSIPIAALFVALLITRGTLAGRTEALADAAAALRTTEENYRSAAATRKASDLVNVERVATESAAISKDTVDDYQARIDRLRADFAERVRLATAANPGSSSGAYLPGVPDPASGTDEGPDSARPSEWAELTCPAQATQLAALQKWNREVAAIDTNGN